MEKKIFGNRMIHKCYTWNNTLFPSTRRVHMYIYICLWVHLFLCLFEINQKLINSPLTKGRCEVIIFFFRF